MCAVLGGRQRRPALDAGAEAAARALVEGAVADDDVGHTRGDGQRRLLDGRARRAAAVVDAAEEGQLADAEAAGDVDVGVGVRAERDHPLHLGRGDAGVVERSGDGLDGEAQLGAARVLGELGGADAGDRGRAGEGVRHQAVTALGPAGSSTCTVPVTWSPRWLAPRMATVTVAALPVVGQRALLRDRAGERHGAVGVVGRAEADAHIEQGGCEAPTSRSRSGRRGRWS